jgi:hypothetical protein
MARPAALLLLAAALLAAAPGRAPAARAAPPAFDPARLWLGGELAHLATGWGPARAVSVGAAAGGNAFARQVGGGVGMGGGGGQEPAEAGARSCGAAGVAPWAAQAPPPTAIPLPRCHPTQAAVLSREHRAAPREGKDEKAYIAVK